jgi:hypothetical protein
MFLHVITFRTEHFRFQLFPITPVRDLFDNREVDCLVLIGNFLR